VLPRLVLLRHDPWHPAQTAVAGFVLALLSLTLGVSTFAQRERLGELRDAASEPIAPAAFARLRRQLLALWTRCALIGVCGGVLAVGAASPPASWPFLGGAAALLVLHAPRDGMFARAAA
jgi:hypothetical protein